MRHAIFISFLFLSILGFSNIGSAQTVGSDTSVNIEIVPQLPRANELVNVYLSSYSTNINTATITWRVDGKTILSGVGEKTFSFSMGNEGVRKTLSVTIRTSEGDTITRTIPLKPTSVDLIWQSNGYVPPFYKGKALFSHQNSMTIIAMPHLTNSSGVEISAKNLEYKWKKNGSVVESASGFGKNTYTFEGSLISRPLNISVEVNSANSQVSGFASLNLTPVDPSVIIYKKDPIFGIEFQKALQNNIELKNSSEISIIGMPFFYNRDDLANSLFYKWAINGKPINNESSQSVQTFRQAEGNAGTSDISLTIENVDKILQFGRSNFNLTFGNK